MTVIPAIKLFGWVPFVVLTLVSVLCWAVWADTPDRHEEKSEIRLARLKYCFKLYRWATPILIFALLVPNEETAWYMVGAYAAETAVTSEVAGELGSAAKDMMLQLMQRAKEEVGQIDAEQVKDVAKAAVQEATK